MHWISVLVLCLGFSSVSSLTVKICVPYEDGESGSFLDKCTKAVGLANTDDLTFECVEGGGVAECVEQLESGDAHLTTLDGSDVISANRDYEIQPLIVEKSAGSVPGGTYYAVAVVNREFCDSSTTLDDLEGMRSCHTGYRKSAGWKTPVGTLLLNVEAFNTSPSDPDVEDDAELVAAFFDETCAPRTSQNGPVNTEDGKGALWEDELCSACKGDCTTNDQYYDYSGAFRCLVEGQGDVAFVKHSTVLEYALDGAEDEVNRAWSDKEMDEFRLLCPGGGCMEVGEFEECYLALAPGHALVTSKDLGVGGDDEETGLAIQAAIMEAANDTDFLDESRGLTPNFLWSDGTIGLQAVENGMEGYLPEESLHVFRAFDDLVINAKGNDKRAIYCATSKDELSLCEKMAVIANELIPEMEWGCLQQDTTYSCARAIADGDADWMTARGRDVYAAYTSFGLTAILAEEGEMGDGRDFYSVAVVNKEFCDENEDAVLVDLKGKTTCHPSYGDEAGWEIPIGYMASLEIMDPQDDEPLVENDAETAAAFFGEMCVPNADKTGPQRKRRGSPEEWPPLCQACKGSCSEKGPYYGDNGVHECLEEGVGEVAFMKHTEILKDLDKDHEEEDEEEEHEHDEEEDDEHDHDDEEEHEHDHEGHEHDHRLICPKTPSCVEIDEYEDCNLGAVLARSVIVRNVPSYATRLKSAIMNLTEMEDFTDIVLDEDSNPENHIFSSGVEKFVELEDDVEDLLGTAASAYAGLEKLAAPKGTEVIVCIPFMAGSTDSAECSRIFNAADITGINFECVVGETAETCMRMLYEGEAHLTSLDGGDAYRAHHAFGLVPLVREVGEIGGEGNYYGVAVVNADFCEDEVTLADLEGMRSCHTGYRKMAGWRIPVGVLYSQVEAFNGTRRRGTIEDDAELVANFFETTCAPRISGNGPRNTKDGSGSLWDNLCSGCKGNCLTNDQYYDYDGAFRCLMEEAGDVAFVKHSTVGDYASDGNVDEVFRAWATKPASDFKLLCRDGGCADIDEYESCHLALAPSHALIGSPALGETGSLWDVGRVVKNGIGNAADIPRFFNKARGFINDFPFSISAEGLEVIDGGWTGYITEETDEALSAFDRLIEGEKRFNPGNLATFCAFTEDQLDACLENLKIYEEIESSYLWDCRREDSIEECYASVQKGTSQFMSASPREAVEGFESYNLAMVAAEAIGKQKETVVYSVAVVESETCAEKIYITDFEGKSACFPFYGSDSGWETPVSVMVKQGFFSTVEEDTEEPSKAVESANSFFGKICAPHDQSAADATETLCEACEDECGLDDDYYGPAGAIECLKQNEGGIALTDSTVLEDEELTDGLQLICSHKRECQELNSFKTCNFGLTPTDVILTQGEADSGYIARLRSVLIEASGEKSYTSILKNTRETGELVAIVGSTDLLLERYLDTRQVLDDFETSD